MKQFFFETKIGFGIILFLIALIIIIPVALFTSASFVPMAQGAIIGALIWVFLKQGNWM